MSRLEVTLRVVLLAGLLAVIAASPTVWLTAPVALVAIAATIELAVRPYAADAAAAAAGLRSGGDRTHPGRPGAEPAAVGADPGHLGGGLAGDQRGRADLAADSATDLSWLARPGRAGGLGLWMAAAAVILAGAVLLALAGVRNWDRKPVLAFSVLSRTAQAAVVQVQATSMTNRYQIVATRPGQAAGQYASPYFMVRAGGSGIQVRKRVPLNGDGTWNIDLQAGGKTVRKVQLVVGQ